MPLIPWTRLFGDKKVGPAIGVMNPKQELLFLKVIDRVYPMDQFLEAAQYVENQQKVGNVVLRIA